MALESNEVIIQQYLDILNRHILELAEATETPAELLSRREWERRQIEHLDFDPDVD